MKKSLKLKMTSLIVLSGCATTEVVKVQTLNTKSMVSNYREIYFDNKKCNMTSQYIKSENIGPNQHGLICVTPEEFNRGFVKWKGQCQK